MHSLFLSTLWPFPCPAPPLQSRESSEMPPTLISHTPFLSAVCAYPVFLNLDLLL